MDFDTHSLYREIIMEHSKHPKNAFLQPDLKRWQIKNPICGDSITVQIDVNKKGIIKNIFHQSIGCSISTSSSSIMTQLLKGKSVEEAIKIIENFVKLVKGEKYDESIDFGDAIAYQGVVNYPARFKCATISWEIILNALLDIQKQK